MLRVYEAKSAVGRAQEPDKVGKLLFSYVVERTASGHMEVSQPDEAYDPTLSLPRAAGRVPDVAVQLTTILPSMGMSVEVARHFPGEDAMPDHPAFWYAVQVVTPAGRIETCWLLPSAAFNRLADRSPRPEGGLTLTLAPRSAGETARFVVAPEDLGSRLTSIARDRSGPPPGAPGVLLPLVWAQGDGVRIP